MSVSAVVVNSASSEYATRPEARAAFPVDAPAVPATASLRVSEQGQLRAALDQLEAAARAVRDAALAAAAPASVPPLAPSPGAAAPASGSDAPDSTAAQSRPPPVSEARREEDDGARGAQSMQREVGPAPAPAVTVPAPIGVLPPVASGGAPAAVRSDPPPRPPEAPPAGAARLAERAAALPSAIAAVEARLVALAQAQPDESTRVEGLRAELRAAVSAGLAQVPAAELARAGLSLSSQGTLQVDVPKLEQAIQVAPVQTARIFANAGAGVADRLIDLGGMDRTLTPREPDLAALAQAYRRAPESALPAAAEPRSVASSVSPQAASGSDPAPAGGGSAAPEERLGGQNALIGRLRLIANLMTP